MPANSDHIRRDAEHAARSYIGIDIHQIRRRLDEAAKAHIAERLANAEPGAVLDGKELGQEAYEAAASLYIIDDAAPLEDGRAALTDAATGS